MDGNNRLKYISTAILLSLFISPHLHYHDLSLLIIPVLALSIALVEHKIVSPTRAAPILMGCSIYLLIIDQLPIRYSGYMFSWSFWEYGHGIPSVFRPHVRDYAAFRTHEETGRAGSEQRYGELARHPKNTYSIVFLRRSTARILGSGQLACPAWLCWFLHKDRWRPPKPDRND